MTIDTPATDKAMSGWRVLVPRGGGWGDDVAALLREQGATPVIAPLINFASAEDSQALAEAFSTLGRGSFDWLVVTSATTVDVLVSQDVRVPPSTRIAAVGVTTANALVQAGYRVDLVPSSDNSAAGLVGEWPNQEGAGRALVLQSDIAESVIAEGLSALGFTAVTVTAYRTIGVPLLPEVVAELTAGEITAVLVTSGSVAKQLAEQAPNLHIATVIACIGPRTTEQARAVGLRVHVISPERSAEALVEALADYAGRL
ncbi:MAG TPA: uroporphyrinogen-III synthase [Pseudolysinimonas sp.]|nr:uroporphyrinogen-III synthase [Pseudolysinimonas sp.]